MTQQEIQKQQIQRKALDVAEFQHKEDSTIAAINARIDGIKKSIQAEEKIVQGLRKDMQVELTNKKKILMAYIPAELKD